MGTYGRGLINDIEARMARNSSKDPTESPDTLEDQGKRHREYMAKAYGRPVEVSCV
jgi:hypothetical protein